MEAAPGAAALSRYDYFFYVMENAVQRLLRQRALLQKEYDYEKAQFEHDTEVMGIDRKIKRGQCWWPVRLGRAYYNSLNQYVIEVERGGDEADDDVTHCFEYGRSVCFFSRDARGNLSYFRFTSTVSYAGADAMVVSLPGGPQQADALREADYVGVQLYFDETTYRLMFSALDRVIAARDGRLAELREVFHGGRQAEWGAWQPVSLPWLNAVQQQAVSQALRARDVAIVHGTPGTGKTTTLVEAIYEVLRREPQVMVCAQSNMAVDWISEKLTERGLSVLRVGNPTRVTDAMFANCYEQRFAAHPDYPQLWAIRREIRRMYAAKRRGGESVHQKIARLKDRAAALELEIRQTLFSQARVVASTLAGAASQLLVGQHFHTLFIDEAAQALEAACWIALQRADRVIMAGDHCQLMPTILSPEALKGGLGETLMEHVAGRRPECVTLLTTQYRMNDRLMRFSSEWFYGGRVKSAPEVSGRSLLDYDVPLEWVDAAAVLPDTAVREEMVGGSYGRVNQPEARLTVDTLRQYILRIGPERFLTERLDVGIISPYRVQVHYLRHLVRSDVFFKPYRSCITINTVDGFQGQERDIVMVSLVRANSEGQIGFLRDLRRMNVAMTRARHKLIILGDVATLTRHRFYKALYDYSCRLKADALN